MPSASSCQRSTPGGCLTTKITSGTLFRGETVGELVGPYISQFLWLEIPYGIKTIDQRYRFPGRNQYFLKRFSTKTTRYLIRLKRQPMDRSWYPRKISR
jgi:hypothetical protein